MSDRDTSPVALVQNPAFGSLLLWSFGRSYQAEKVGDLPSLIPFFLVLPLLLHGPTLRDIRSTNQSSGLSKLVSKLAERREHLLEAGPTVSSAAARTSRDCPRHQPRAR